jgi:DNA-binding NtrC family response regulator
MKHVLLVDDNRSLLEGMAEALAQEEISVSLAETAKEALDAFDKRDFAVVVCDLKLPDTSGLDVLKTLKERDAGIHVILITAHGSVDIAVEAMQAGAFDFVTKPFPADEIVARVKKALERHALEDKVTLLTTETAVLRQEIKDYFDPDAIVGESAALADIKKNIERLSQSNVAVLILGETGTGKELIARAVHYKSKRNTGPFIRVNCAVLSETLLESELFGHEKGAFTDAVAHKAGLFELANKGTICLDEISELSVSAQAKLLRVLQEHEFERVGGTDVISVDVRVVAATNRNLEQEVKNGGFREDLYYRLNVVPIELPPLRERKGDIPRLLQHFLERYSRENHKRIEEFSGEAMKMIMEYDWPGNIRELENMVERGVVLSESSRIEAALLPFSNDNQGASTNGAGTLVDKVAGYEKQLIEETLQACDNNTTKAAKQLGISRSTLRYKIEKYSR